jgi:hypothetical protein
MRNIALLIISFLTTITVANAQWVKMGNNIVGNPFDKLGYSISINSDGSIMAIGAPFENQNTGYVGVYRFVSNEWQQIGTNIIGEDNYNYSGSSIDINSDGTVLAIGAFSNDDGVVNRGHVRIYKNINEEWQQIGIDIDGTKPSDYFGSSVCISDDGSIVAIGAPAPCLKGYIRIYKNEEDTWEQVGNDIIGDTIGDRFGLSVSLNGNGNTVAIGATKDNYHSGYVKIYENNSDSWQQVGTDINGEQYGGSFGSSVSINSEGTTVAIGDYSADGDEIYNNGEVKVYNNNSGNWQQLGSDINGDESSDLFGCSVSLNSDGTILAIGAYQNSNSGLYANGQVKVLKYYLGTWQQISTYIGGDFAQQFYGKSVCINDNGSIVAVGGDGYANAFVTESIGVNELNSTDFKFYPNPTKGKLSIVTENIEKIEIYNISGVKVIITNKKELDLRKLAKGVYFIKVITEKGSITKKIIFE